MADWIGSFSKSDSITGSTRQAFLETLFQETTASITKKKPKSAARVTEGSQKFPILFGKSDLVS